MHARLLAFALLVGCGGAAPQPTPDDPEEPTAPDAPMDPEPPSMDDGTSTGEDPSGTGYVDGSESSGSESSSGDALDCEAACDPVNLAGPDLTGECGCACDYVCTVTGDGPKHTIRAVFACGLTDEPMDIGTHVLVCVPA